MHISSVWHLLNMVIHIHMGYAPNLTYLGWMMHICHGTWPQCCMQRPTFEACKLHWKWPSFGVCTDFNRLKLDHAYTHMWYTYVLWILVAMFIIATHICNLWNIALIWGMHMFSIQCSRIICGNFQSSRACSITYKRRSMKYGFLSSLF